MNNVPTSFSGMAICVVSSGRKTDIKWALTLPTLIYPVGMSVGWFARQSDNRAENRERLVEEALKVGAPYVLFIDDDTIPPPWAPRYLHAEINKDPKVMVCGGIYCTKENPPSPIVFKELGGGPFYNWKMGDTFECAGIGAGCMLIKTEVFKHLSKPWFLEPDEIFLDKVIEINGIKCPLTRNVATDDLFFCKKVLDAGFKIVAHGGVLPVHLDEAGNMYALPADSYPCREKPSKRLGSNDIPGWMDELELEWLYAMAACHKSVVEVGSWLGRSTYALLSGCHGTVTSVDHFKGSPSELNTTHRQAKTEDIHAGFLSNVGHFPNLEVLKMDSLEAADLFKDKSIEMVFLDGDHTPEAALADLKAWLPKCSKLFCGHDRNFEGISGALKSMGLKWKEGPGSLWYVELI
jgi:hypothetical protein